MTNTELLRKHIKDSGLKLHFIAEKMGITRAALTNKITNESEFKVSEVLILCDLLGIDDSEEQRRVFFMPIE